MRNPDNAIKICGLYVISVLVIFFLRKIITNENVRIILSLIELVFTVFMLLRYGKDGIMVLRYLFTKK